MYRVLPLPLFNNLVLAVPQMGQFSENGTLPECQMFLVLGCFVNFLYVNSSPIIKKWSEANVP